MNTSNTYPATGGSDYESIESMRERIPLQVRTQGVAITKKDYEDLALLVPGVSKAKLEYQCGRKVSLYIYPTDPSVQTDLQASSTLCNRVWSKLQPYLPITTVLKVYPLGTSDIVLDVDITGRPNYKSLDILTHVRTALYTAYNSQNSDIGGTVRISDLYALMDNLPSIDFLRINKFYVRPYLIPLNSGIGFSPVVFDLDYAEESVTYIITVTSSTIGSIVSSDGKFSLDNINLIGRVSIIDTSHKVKFDLTLLTSSQASSDLGRIGNQYKMVVCHINNDYVDTGYTIPIFSRDVDLTTNITETI